MQSCLFHDFRLYSECKSPKRFLLARFNLAFSSFALRSAALRLLTSEAKFLRSSTSDNTASNFDKRSTRIFFSSRNCLRLVLEKIFLYFFSTRQSESKLSLFSLIEKAPDLRCCTLCLKLKCKDGFLI